MIKDIKLKPFTNTEKLPTYARWKGLDIYTLKAIITDGYEITIGVLTVGKSSSNGKMLNQVSYESYNDHGRKMYEARARNQEEEGVIIAATSAMIATGVLFNDIKITASVEDILRAVGGWYMAHNPDIVTTTITKQRID